MAENLGEWPSKRRPTSKTGHRMAAKGMPFPWRRNGGTISLNLGVIWEMSVQTETLPRGEVCCSPAIG